MSRLERLTWYWSKKDATIRNEIDGDPRCISLKFEDILDPHTEFAGAFQLIDFLSEEAATVSRERVLAQLQKRKNATGTHTLPHWSEWSEDQQTMFSRIAGEHMKRSGYALGPTR